MLFKQGTPLYAFEVQREGGEDVMYVNYLGSPFVPNLVDNSEVMARTVSLLIDNPQVSKIVFVQQRNYAYDFAEVSLLQDVSHLYTYLTKQEKILSPEKLSIGKFDVGKRHSDVSYLLELMKRDPIASYVELKRILREERINLDRLPGNIKADQVAYIRMLEKFLKLFEETKLIKQAIPYLGDYELGDREIYVHFFRPDVIPNFTFTRLVATLPPKSEIIRQYDIASGYDKSSVTILKRENESKFFYHIMPPEYSLTEDYHMLLNLARNVLIEHQPKSEEFIDPERTRRVFFNISRDLLQELAKSKNLKLSYSELNKLATILVRHTIGFGIVEVLLQDKNLQDIVLNLVRTNIL